MSDDSSERIEGLEPKALFNALLNDAPGDPERAEQAAEDERRIRAEIEQRLPDLELLELLGRGGMGFVFRALQKKLDRVVALKVIAPEAERQEGFAERFEREAQALARLSHPGIVAVHDYGQEGSFCWLVMEYVDGSNLRDVIRAGRLEPAEALALIPGICEALQYAHDRGVVHRDVKPENILLDTEGRVKIADFGLAKLTGTPAALVSLTGSHQVLGTFRYMAPEQLDRPLEVDHRADIYSLGVVFYEMLTGEIPMGRFDPPSQHSEASTRVDDVVLRALEKEPERRYQHASEVKSDLDSLEGGRPRPAPRAGEPAQVERAPRLCLKAVASAVLFGMGSVPILASLVVIAASESAAEAPRSRASWASIAGIVMPFLGLVVPALMMIGGAALGFRALAEIRRAWPRLYGAGAAVVGAWGGVLVFAHAAILVVAFTLRGVPGEDSLRTLLGATLVLLPIEVALLIWCRRRFLRSV